MGLRSCGVTDGESQCEGLGVFCLACDGPLHFLPDCYPLIFRCVNGHCLTLQDLLNHDLPHTTAGRGDLSQYTLDNWTTRARLFDELSASALRNGHAFMAADFQDAAHRIEGWVASLTALRAKRTLPRTTQD